METSEAGPVPLSCRACETQIVTIAEFEREGDRFLCPTCGSLCFVRSDESDLLQ